jgi:hypothetical protein
MSRRIVVTLLVIVLACACGGTPPPAGPSVAPIGSVAPTPVKSGPRREPSAAIKKYWPFRERAEMVVYADLEGLLHTDLMKDIVPGMLAIGKASLTQTQHGCARDLVASLREVLVGANDDLGVIAIVRYDAASMKTPLGDCLQALLDAKAEPVGGAGESYRAAGRHILVVQGIMLVADNDETITKALQAEGSADGGGARSAERPESRLGGVGGRSPPTEIDVALAADQFVSVDIRIPRKKVQGHGGIYASSERFKIDADVDVGDEETAVYLEKTLSGERGKQGLAQLSSVAKGDQVAAVKRLVDAISVTRTGSRLAVAFELKEPPSDQAHDIGTGAALAVYGVRQYIVQSKAAEARNTIGQIAKDFAAWWEMEEGPNPTARSKKKLFSIAATPKAVPKGVKYVSSPADWKPWSKLRFEMGSPQYYQYEVKAAPDGKSAEIIARGDLNGDGKTSLFKLSIAVQGDRLLIAPAIHEENPEE